MFAIAVPRRGFCMTLLHVTIFFTVLIGFVLIRGRAVMVPCLQENSVQNGQLEVHRPGLGNRLSLAVKPSDTMLRLKQRVMLVEPVPFPEQAPKSKPLAVLSCQQHPTTRCRCRFCCSMVPHSKTAKGQVEKWLPC